MKNKNWFWGILFLLAAVFVIASQFNFFMEIGVLSIIAAVLLAAILVDSLIRLHFFVFLCLWPSCT
jgi:hypothetical protein